MWCLFKRWNHCFFLIVEYVSVCVCFTLFHYMYYMYLFYFQCFFFHFIPYIQWFFYLLHLTFYIPYLSISAYSQAAGETDLSLSCAFSLMCYSLHLPAYFSLSLLFHLSVYSLLQCCRLRWVFGYEVSSYLRQPAVGFQRFPHLEYRYIYVASTLCSSGQAGQN